MTQLRQLGVALLLAASFAALIPATSSAAALGTRPLAVGTKGKDVRALQRSLTALGYTAPETGVYDKPTKQAVRKLERKQGWRVDGKVSRKDAMRIAKLAAAGAKKPQSIYYLYGLTNPSVTATSTRAGTSTVDVVDVNSGLTVYTFAIAFAGAETQTVTWTGYNNAAGAWAADSTYKFKVADPGAPNATISGGATKPFLLRLNQFPVPGSHSFGGAASRFGAQRSGHIHQGQDMSASCGERMYAAEGGTVTTKAYQASGAGYYLVIHGVITGTDYVYMHLQKPSWLEKGGTTYTGQQIGKVGTTGSSTGCHLHFERWSAPGWYKGGAAYDPLPELQYWDAYS